MDRRSDLAVHDVLPDLFPGFGESAPLELPPLSARTEQEVCDLLVSGRFDAWSQALANVGNCAQPIRLRGRSETVDATTGEIVSSYSSEQDPLGVTHVRCGNRRASECPSCSRLYAADMFQLIRAGVAGGKTVPASVAENPLVFATVTAPSFGPVHGRRATGRCHPHAGNERTCEHGRPRTCRALHVEDDPTLGQPICGDCYDYASHLVWQWWAPDLWRRFTIALHRLVAKQLQVPANRLAEVATVQYAKVAEYQVRGAVHFHALVRLDGPRTPDGFAPAPPTVDATRLAGLVRAAAASVRLNVPGVDASDPARLLAFGRQLDARPVRSNRRTDDPDRALSPEQVAGYLAKYATKSITDTGATGNAHHRRLRATARDLAVRAEAAQQDSYELLGKWTHMLGFRGHFASKSRRYSVTLGALRRARRRAQALIAQSRAEGRPLDLAALEADLLAEDNTETTLVIGHWHYVGSGWNTEAERVLAIAAAARAREYAQWRAAQSRSSHGSGDRTT
jgi:replication initiator protein RepSA